MPVIIAAAAALQSLSMVRLWMALVVSLGLFAQVMPTRLEGRCTEDDIQRLGLSCSTEEPCPILLELASVEPVANRIVLAGNLHTSSVTLASILLTSEDGGRTWMEPFERIAAASLDQIQFLDFQYGWIGGQLLLAVPRDPFLLLTDDGGKTWRRSPVFSESRAGAIEVFRFTSRTHGLLWIDRTQAGEAGLRHELYETVTGGSSWTLLQSSDRPLLARRAETASRNADWRLHPDAATKSYRLERRQEGRWQTLARFPIAAGECKPPELVPTEPSPAIR